MKLPLIKFDCKHLEGDRPCFANKKELVFCGDCNYYEKDKTINDNFPGIEPYTPAGDAAGSIAIIKLDASGDVLRTTSVLPSLKKKYPEAEITWITRSSSYAVLRDNELIDEIYFTDDNLDDVFGRKFDIGINLDSGKESCAIMNRLNCDTRFGYCLANGKPYPVNELAVEWYLMGVDDSAKKSNKKTYNRIINEICGLEPVNSRPIIRITGEKKKRAGEISDKFGLKEYNDFILVNLGGGSRWQNKKWTPEGYLGLINRISSRAGTAVGVIAGAEDTIFYSGVVKSLPKKSNILLFGCENSLDDFICILYLSDRVFTSDSLALHIASALEKYVVVIVGPTSHTELDVFGKGRVLLSSKMECKCFYAAECTQQVNCMNTISVDEAEDALINQ